MLMMEKMKKVRKHGQFQNGLLKKMFIDDLHIWLKMQIAKGKFIFGMELWENTDCLERYRLQNGCIKKNLFRLSDIKGKEKKISEKPKKRNEERRMYKKTLMRSYPELKNKKKNPMKRKKVLSL